MGESDYPCAFNILTWRIEQNRANTYIYRNIRPTLKSHNHVCCSMCAMKLSLNQIYKHSHKQTYIRLEFAACQGRKRERERERTFLLKRLHFLLPISFEIECQCLFRTLQIAVYNMKISISSMRWRIIHFYIIHDFIYIYSYTNARVHFLRLNLLIYVLVTRIQNTFCIYSFAYCVL